MSSSCSTSSSQQVSFSKRWIIPSTIDSMASQLSSWPTMRLDSMRARTPCLKPSHCCASSSSAQSTAFQLQPVLLKKLSAVSNYLSLLFWPAVEGFPFSSQKMLRFFALRRLLRLEMISFSFIISLSCLFPSSFTFNFYLSSSSCIFTSSSRFKSILFPYLLHLPIYPSIMLIRRFKSNSVYFRAQHSLLDLSWKFASKSSILCVRCYFSMRMHLISSLVLSTCPSSAVIVQQMASFSLKRWVFQLLSPSIWWFSWLAAARCASCCLTSSCTFYTQSFFSFLSYFRCSLSLATRSCVFLSMLCSCSSSRRSPSLPRGSGSGMMRDSTTSTLLFLLLGLQPLASRQELVAYFRKLVSKSWSGGWWGRSSIKSISLTTVVQSEMHFMESPCVGSQLFEKSGSALARSFSRMDVLFFMAIADIISVWQQQEVVGVKVQLVAASLVHLRRSHCSQLSRGLTSSTFLPKSGRKWQRSMRPGKGSTFSALSSSKNCLILEVLTRKERKLRQGSMLPTQRVVFRRLSRYSGWASRKPATRAASPSLT